MCRTIEEGQRICPCRQDRDSALHNKQRRDARAARRRAARWVGVRRGQQARAAVMSAAPGKLADLTIEFGIPEHVWRVPPVRKAHLGDLESWGFTTGGTPAAQLPVTDAALRENADDAQQWRNALSPGEVDAILHYTADGHYDINASLARGVDQKHIAYIDELDSALIKAPYRLGAQTYYRGVDCPADELQRYGHPARWMQRTYPIGSTVDIPGYMSTSTSPHIAQKFCGDNGIVFEVRTREGAHLGHLSAVGGGESEVLMPRGIRWRVIGSSSSTQSPHAKPTVYLVPDDEVPYETEGLAPGFTFDDEPPF